MKNCIALNVFLLLFLAQLGATNPVLDNNGVPLAPREVVKSKELFLDFSIPAKKEKSLESLSVAGKESAIGQRFQFPDLDKQLTAAIEDMVNDIAEDDMADVTNIPENAEEKEGKKAIEEAKIGGTRIESLTDLTDLTLPAYYIQEIGNIEAIVVINTLKIVADPDDDLEPGGRLGLYIGVKIPQKTRDQSGNLRSVTLIFGTEEIAFTSSGGISAGNIKLVNDAWFETSGSKKKAIVRLHKGDIRNHEQYSDQNTGTYIRFGCNGVEEFAIGGEVHFSREWVVPVDEFGVLIPSPPPPAHQKRVKAELQVKVQDWNNMTIKTSISHFALTKYKEVTFAVGNCTVDLSDYENPTGMKFPAEYEFPPELEFPDETEFPETVPPNLKNLWRGVYIETFEMTFPRPFKKKCDGNYGNNNNPNAEGCRMKLTAEKLIIDRTGVSGKFSISGQSPLASGAMMDNKWSYSVDEVGVSVVQNRFDMFHFQGGMVLPITKKSTPFAYEGRIDFLDPSSEEPDGQQSEQSADYFFGVTLQENLEFPVFKAFNVRIDSSSTLEVTVSDGNFKPKAVLFGQMTLGKGGGASAAQALKVPKIKFANLTLETNAPYVTSGNVFLQGGGSELNKFPIQISGIGLEWGTDPSTGEAKLNLAFQAGLHLMNSDDGGLTTTGSFKILGKVVTNVVGAQEWKFKDLKMDGFALVIDLPAFKAEGSLQFFDGNDDYGKGFSAMLEVDVMPKPADDTGQGGHKGFELDMAAIFGNKDGMRYFMVDGFATGPAINVPLPPTPLILDGFGGGVQYRMKLDGYRDPNSIPEGSVLPIGTDVSGLIYKPDPATVFGIKFATSFTVPSGDAGGGKPIDGMLSCIIRFGPQLSLQNITFWGTAELMVPVKDGGIDLTPAMDERMSGLTDSEDEMQEKDMKKTQEAVDKIAAKVGLSLDFYDGFSIHGFAEVNMKASQGKLTGKGQLDLLIDPNGDSNYPDGRWHLFIGGYDNGAIKVPEFFHPENEITLLPANAQLTYSGASAKIESYFLMGNKIPGPPPINGAAANFFDIPTNSNIVNRENLESCANLATGAGVAFGANVDITYQKKIKRDLWIGSITILDIKAFGRAGFDIGLIQYDPDVTYCAGTPPGTEHGINGFRATGNIWAYIDVTGKVLGFELLNLGLGVFLQADIPNPSFFRAKAVLRFMGTREYEFPYGGPECGHPCSIE